MVIVVIPLPRSQVDELFCKKSSYGVPVFVLCLTGVSWSWPDGLCRKSSCGILEFVICAAGVSGTRAHVTVCGDCAGLSYES